jgi:nucleoside-diphosphate-sugar epimerase
LKTACVTGSAGFIGGHVWEALEGAGYDVHGIDPAAIAGRDARDYFRNGEAYWDVVVHCAAVVGGRRVMDWTPLQHAANLEIDAALFGWAARTRPGRVVYLSSSCAYPVAYGQEGHPLRECDIDTRTPKWPDQLYGWTKLTGELLAETARNDGLTVSICRPFSVYGPGMHDGFAVRGFLEQVTRRADPVEIWGDAGQVRDYIHVTDVAAAVVTMIAEGIDGPVNLGTGRGTMLLDLAGMMASMAGYAPQVLVDSAMPAGVPHLVADATLLRSFCPPRVALEDGLAGMMAR